MNKIQVFCDFDGTITRRDTVDFLLSELALPEWEEIEEQWVKGEIGARECMSRQVALIQGGWGKVRELLDTLNLTEGVHDFVNWCRSKNIPFVVVSDGIDRVIEYILSKNGIQPDAVYANHLIEDSAGAFSLQASSRPRLANCQSGVCKCRLVGQQAYQMIRVVVGDGRSDFCWSKEADLLYSKGKLSEFCLAEGIGYNDFNTFFDIQDSLNAVSQGLYAPVVFNKPLLPLAVPALAPGLSNLPPV
ncbi:MAG: MtnX-like HAD-IB family phosphatase [Candidatus Obscuribacterales bacterium]|nr:MtnX-like HAD-IB family phosphatase [Candidatus Obscuribacterales bacterium]